MPAATRPSRHHGHGPTELNEADFEAIQEIDDRKRGLTALLAPERVANAHLDDRFGGSRSLHKISSRSTASRPKGEKKQTGHHLSITFDGQCPCVCDRPSADGYRQCQFHVNRGHGSLEHPRTERWQEDLKWLRSICSQRANVFAFDAEFSVFPGLCAVAWEVSIRDMNGKEIMACTTVYDGATVDDFLERYRLLSPPDWAEDTVLLLTSLC